MTRLKEMRLLLMINFYIEILYDILSIFMIFKFY